MTLPSHITAAIRRGDFTYADEVLLSNWGNPTKNKNRSWAEFILNDIDKTRANPFENLEGQRFALIAVPIGDDEQVEKPEKAESTARHLVGTQEKPVKPPERWEEMNLAKQAGIRCGDTGFRAWLSHEDWIGDEFTNPNTDDPAEAAAQLVRRWCHVTSRSELNTIPEAGDLWRWLDEQYRRDTNKVAEQRG